MPGKLSWADIVWNSHALVMMIVGGKLVMDYPVALGAKKMDGPFKWWTLISLTFIAANTLPIIPWSIYMFVESK